MKGKRYSNEQIIYVLKRVESGDKANEGSITPSMPEGFCRAMSVVATLVLPE
jgi:hypothetical protein